MKLQGLRNTLRRIATVAAAAVTSAAVAVSCTESGFGDLAPEGGETESADEIVIAVPELSAPGVSTRVVMADDTDNPQEGDEIHLQWSAGDTFSLWATGETNNSEYKNMRFLYKGSKYSEGVAYFVSNDIPRMDEGTYLYRAFAPCPDEENVDRENNRIYYDIPVRQNGSYDNGRLDIMSSTQAVRSSALVRDFFNREMDITFRHETHALKITIPADRNRFGETIERIRIEFPQPVAGKLAFDAATGEADTEGITESFVDVVFDEPVAADEGCTFWVFIAPTTIDGEVRFTAYGGGGERFQSDPTVAAQGAFTVLAKGVITPVKLTVAEGFTVTWFEYEVLDKSRVGEPVQTLNFTLPSGLRAADRSEDENGVVRIMDDGEGRFSLSLRTQELQRYFRRGGEAFSFQPKFETEHALVPPYAKDIDKFYVSSDNYQPDGHNQFEQIDHVPYLFEEDFSSIGDISSYDEYGRGTNSWPGVGGNYNAVTLLESGWTAGRVGAMAGTAIRLACRRETSARYYARVDSAPLVNIKENVKAHVKILFDYGADRYGGGLLGSSQTGGANIGQTVYLGYVTENEAYGSQNGTINEIRNFSIPSSELNGYYTYLPHTEESFEIVECENFYRLTWRTYPDASASVNNNTCWFYLDNIIVQIANE